MDSIMKSAAADQPEHKPLKLDEFDPCDTGSIYFITLPVIENSVALYEEEFAAKIIGGIYQLWLDGMFSLYVYCLMPDHLHLVISLKPTNNPRIPKNIVTVIDYLRQYTNEIAHYYEAGDLWEETCFDCVLSFSDDLKTKCEYILNNPLRKKLVTTADEWQFAGMIDPLP